MNLNSHNYFEYELLRDELQVLSMYDLEMSIEQGMMVVRFRGGDDVYIHCGSVQTLSLGALGWLFTRLAQSENADFAVKNCLIQGACGE